MCIRDREWATLNVLNALSGVAKFHPRSAVDLARRYVEGGLAFSAGIAGPAGTTGRALDVEVTLRFRLGVTILEVGVPIFPVHTSEL